MILKPYIVSGTKMSSAVFTTAKNCTPREAFGITASRAGNSPREMQIRL